LDPQTKDSNARSGTALDTDILIVGAGPVGLFLANECARRGLRYTIIELRASQSEHSKALAIFPRTMEIFDMAGVVSPFLAAANRVTSVSVIAHGREIAQMRFLPQESPYSFVAMVPQDVTEALLLEELRRKGGAVEYETSFATAVQQSDRVTATVEHNGQSRQINAAFVVGCDGARSAARKTLQLPLEGGEYEAKFMLADIETNDNLSASEMQLCPSELGPVAIFPMSATRRRVVATTENAEGDAPSLELVRQVLAQRGPSGFEARALHWSSYFRIHHRHVTRLQVKRVFIAGDAAHLHSPFGGQGMNTGLHDVWNLVWKLDLSLRGLGNQALLESYTTERLPVIEDVVETTDLLTKVMATPNKFAQVLRDTLIPMVSRLAPFQHAFVQKLSELGIAYRNSPIVEGPGKRHFDDSMCGGKGICSRFLLLLNRNTEKHVAEAARQLADSFPDLVELRQGTSDDLMLVRPDGYLAYSAHHHDGLAALKTVRSLLDRQTSPQASAQRV
jgi:2-polyprenyl-6-methoxyphenol hydroxylase-like FAD-dependent oxidoreductase